MGRRRQSIRGGRLPAAVCVALVAAGPVVGCGGGRERAPAAERSRAPGAAGRAAGSAANAYIGSLAIDPADGTLYLGTAKGLFRVDPGERRPSRVIGRLRTSDGSGSVSANLLVRSSGPGELIASGHPDGGGTPLPENLGLVRSADGGRTWESVADLGEADYHALQVSGTRVTAVDAEDPGIKVSQDGGQSWEPRTPPAAPLDVAMDPADPARLVVITEQGVFASGDQGRSWRRRDAARSDRLAWAAADALYRADPGGLIRRSRDGGATWQDRGTVGAGADALAAGPDGTLYASVAGGEVRRSTDGGATWRRHLVLK